MQFEVIRKSHKKKVVIGSCVFIAVIGVLLVKNSFAKYQTVKSFKIVEGTINYTMPDFDMLAMYQQKEENCTENNCYEEIANGRMPTIGYIINTSNSHCDINNEKDTGAKLYTNEAGEHVIYALKKGSKCYVYFDKDNNNPSKVTLATLNVDINLIKNEKPIFSVIAAGSESAENNGIYKIDDGMYGGTSYYWRGAVTTNHIIFAEYCWRIVRINGDGSIRLIYNGTIGAGNVCPGNGRNTGSVVASSQTYSTNGAENNSSYVGYTYTYNLQRPIDNTDASPSNLKTQTDNWYNNKINIEGKEYDDKVVYGKFCNDRSTRNNAEWLASGGTSQYYAVYDRVYKNYVPTLDCPEGDVYELKAGAITADEAMYAGGNSEVNKSYYLYNGVSYHTMSPDRWYGTNKVAFMFHIGSDGSIDEYWTSSKYSVRPVINLRADVKLTGTGTASDPYVVQ